MRKGEIILVEIPVTGGHEQAGMRPAIIISEVEANIAIIIPFTSNLSALRYPHTIEVSPSESNGLKTDSVALVFQLRAIDDRRIKDKLGTLDNEEINKIDKMIVEMLLIQ
ncbi:type II toxin-antitoxin system PemK/MazF family toxin [bacterium]|nr:type II toxin-antitoxin system PemK/MazF family toxin [bacterium]